MAKGGVSQGRGRSTGSGSGRGGSTSRGGGGGSGKPFLGGRGKAPAGALVGGRGKAPAGALVGGREKAPAGALGKRRALTAPMDRAEKRRGKLVASEDGGEPVHDGETPVGGDHLDIVQTPPPAKAKSTVGSSNSSNPSPPSQGTRVSHTTISASRTKSIPLQYPPSTNPTASRRIISPQNLNLNLRAVSEEVPVPEEEDEEDEEEEVAGEEVEDEEVEDDVDVVDDNQPEGEDDHQMFQNLLALPGRERLPLLSEVPIPHKKTLW